MSSGAHELMSYRAHELMSYRAIELMSSWAHEISRSRTYRLRNICLHCDIKGRRGSWEARGRKKGRGGQGQAGMILLGQDYYKRILLNLLCIHCYIYRCTNLAGFAFNEVSSSWAHELMSSWAHDLSSSWDIEVKNLSTEEYLFALRYQRPPRKLGGKRPRKRKRRTRPSRYDIVGSWIL